MYEVITLVMFFFSVIPKVMYTNKPRKFYLAPCRNQFAATPKLCMFSFGFMNFFRPDTSDIFTHRVILYMTHNQTSSWSLFNSCICDQNRLFCFL